MPGAEGPRGRISILIAGYTRIYAELLAAVLKRDRSIHVVGVASSSQEALAISTQSRVDVAAISLNLDEQPERGCDVVRELRTLHPGIRVIMLLDSAKKEKVINAFRAGAKGVFSKNSPLSRLSKCVRCVHGGQIWISHQELELVLENLTNSPAIRAIDAKGVSLLTARERAIVECVAEGLANHEIADRLNLSRHTIKNYLFRIFDKLGVSNRVELIFLTFCRNPEKHNKIPPSSERELSPTVQLGHDEATTYLQCLIAERDIGEQQAQLAARKDRLAASLTREQISRAEQQASISPLCLDNGRLTEHAALKRHQDASADLPHTTEGSETEVKKRRGFKPGEVRSA